MRFHVGLFFRPKLSWIKWILLPLLGFLAYFGIGNFVVLAATGTLEPSEARLCSPGQCSSTWMGSFTTGSSSVLGGATYRSQSIISDDNDVSQYNYLDIVIDASEFSSYCYESEYDFKATYSIHLRTVYTGNNYTFVSIPSTKLQVFANYGTEISSTTTCTNDGDCKVTFTYPKYGTDIMLHVPLYPGTFAHFPLVYHQLQNADITCISKNSNTAIVNSIENQTTSIINNNNSNTESIINNNNTNTQNIIDSQNEIHDSITDDTIDSNTSSGAGHFFGDYHLDDTRGFSNIVLSPIEFLRNLLTSADSCSPLSLPLHMKDDNVDSGVHNLAVPCGDILWSRAPTAVESIWFILIWGIVGYRILLDVVKFVNAMINPENSKEFFLEL